MRKIRDKFLAVFLIVGLVPLVVMGIIALLSVYRTHRVDISSLELQLLAQKKEEIQKLLDETVSLFQLQVGFEQTVEIAKDAQQFLLEGMLTANKHLKEVSFMNLKGEETSKLFRGLEENESTTLLNISKLEKFGQAKKGNDFLGKVYYTLEGPMITVASPVKNKNGIVIMVLAGELDLSPIQIIAQNAKLGNQGYFYVLDERGKLFAHSNPSRLSLQQFLGDHPFSASILQGENRSGLEDRDRFQSSWQEDVIAAGMRLPNTNWALLVEWPAEDAFSVIRTINRQLYVIAGGAFLIIVLLTFWVARKIAKPISILKEGASIIGQGQFEHRIQIQTHDELETLGEAFNKMAVDLAKVEELRAKAIRAEALEKTLEKEKELSHNKDMFIKNASHQLRTPLASISWGLESLVAETEQKEPGAAKTAKAAYEGTQSLNEILNDLLTVSEYGFGYSEEKRESVNLDQILKETTAEFQPIFQKKNITSAYRSTASKTNAASQATVLKKALSYLFDNASIYANSKLDVTLKEDGKELVIVLNDDGIGIPEDDKKLIFTQFFRAKNAIVKKNVGTGLGLFLAKNMIEGIGGRIWFESQENKGSTFFVAFTAG